MKPRKQSEHFVYQPNVTVTVTQEKMSFFDAAHACLSVISEFKQGARLVSELFQTLPSKAEYPDYFIVIKSPIALDMISKKLSLRQYHSFEGQSITFLKFMFHVIGAGIPVHLKTEDLTFPL
jgi:hypothetical protein